MDPVIEAADCEMRASFDTLRRVVDGLPAEALNWRPAGEETNSIAVLTTHAMNATRLLLQIAVGNPPMPRDRPAEFEATAEGATSLLELIDDLAADCADTIESAVGVDWSDLRRRERSDGEIVETTAARLLMQGVTHLRGHTDEASLTRHLWMARS